MTPLMQLFDIAREMRACPPGLCLRYSVEDCRCAKDAGRKVIARHELTGFAPADSIWHAVEDDTYDGPGSPIGAGRTHDAAIADLLRQLPA